MLPKLSPSQSHRAVALLLPLALSRQLRLQVGGVAGGGQAARVGVLDILLHGPVWQGVEGRAGSVSRAGSGGPLGSRQLKPQLPPVPAAVQHHSSTRQDGAASPHALLQRLDLDASLGFGGLAGGLHLQLDLWGSSERGRGEYVSEGRRGCVSEAAQPASRHCRQPTTASQPPHLLVDGVGVQHCLSRLLLAQQHRAPLLVSRAGWEEKGGGVSGCRAAAAAARRSIPRHIHPPAGPPSPAACAPPSARSPPCACRGGSGVEGRGGT